MRLLARDRQARSSAAAAVIDDFARCGDHPRDRHSELVRWMAPRCPAGARGGPAVDPPIATTATASIHGSLSR
jgi:hypothetical protein